jgi:hypothetical protein
MILVMVGRARWFAATRSEMRSWLWTDAITIVVMAPKTTVKLIMLTSSSVTVKPL